MIIHAPWIERRAGKAVLSSRVQWTAGDTVVWFSVDGVYGDWLLQDRADAFLVGLLWDAMSLGEDIKLHAFVSPKLLSRVIRHVQPLLRSVFPQLTSVQILSSEVETPISPLSGREVITGFSSGVDSLVTVLDHHEHENFPELRLTALMFANVGSHGEGTLKSNEAVHDFFEARSKLVRRCAEDIGLPLICVDSNLHEILASKHGNTYTLRNASVALALQGRVRTFYGSSAFKYEDIRAKPHDDIGISDPMLLPMLSTDLVDCVSTGSQYSRVEKTELLASWPIAQRWMNVCRHFNNEARNCSECNKCGRTLITLEILGQLESFKQCFDLEIWKRRRRWFVISYLLGRRHDEFQREILAAAKTRGFTFSFTETVGGLAYWLFRSWNSGRRGHRKSETVRNLRRATAASNSGTSGRDARLEPGSHSPDPRTSAPAGSKPSRGGDRISGSQGVHPIRTT